MSHQKTAYICGSFLAGHDVSRKHAFVECFVRQFLDAGWKVTVIDNGMEGGRKLALPKEVKVIHCYEYAYKMGTQFPGLRSRAVRSLWPLFLTCLGQPALCWDLFRSETAIVAGLSPDPRQKGTKRMLWLLLAFAHLCKIVQNVPLRPGDFLLTFLDHPTLHALLRGRAKRSGAKLAVMEYGELQNCMFYSEKGLFHKAWPVVDATLFQSLPLEEKDIESARRWRKQICTNRISNKKSEGKLDNLEEWKDGRPLIFLPALNPIGSGLFPRSSPLSKEISPFFSDNQDMLDAIVEFAEQFNWCVLYKDHPNTHAYYPNLLSNRLSNRHLLMAGNVDVHDILDRAAVTFTLGGKTAFVSLMRGVPVVLAGPFTLSGSGLVEEMEDRASLGETIRRAIERKNVATAALDCFNARLIRYYLFRHTREEDGVFMRGPHDASLSLLDYADGQRRLVSQSDGIPSHS